MILTLAQPMTVLMALALTLIVLPMILVLLELVLMALASMLLSHVTITICVPTTLVWLSEPTKQTALTLSLCAHLMTSVKYRLAHQQLVVYPPLVFVYSTKVVCS